MSTDLNLLIYVLKNSNGLFTTASMAKEFDVSQQTISRRLMELEDKGYIIRHVTNQGIRVIVDKKGYDLLKDKYVELKNILHRKTHSCTGMLISGLGEGKYYMGMKKYRDQIKQKLSFSPYPGTLNIKVDPLDVKQLISHLKKIPIQGFETKERSYGSLDAYRIKINEVQGALIIPQRSHYDLSTIELIAPVNLRKKLGLKDGDKLTIYGD